MELLDTAAPPLSDPISGKDGALTVPWSDYFGRLPITFAAFPARFRNAALTTQAASIGATALDSSVNEGLYRLTYYARITRAGTVSSSLTVTLSWTDGGVACSYAGSAITGNTTATVQSGTVMVRSDHAAINYATTYASAGATTMQYALDVVLERVLA